MGGRVEQHGAEAGRGQRLDEAGELAAPAGPAVDEVDDRALAPDVAADLGAERGDRERLAAGWQRAVRGQRGDGEPQVRGRPRPASRGASSSPVRKRARMPPCLKRTIVLFWNDDDMVESFREGCQEW